MGRRSRTQRLALYMNGERVGSWSQGPNTDTLDYAPEWLANPAARPISLRFPLAPAHPYKQGVSDYFDNLLPDARNIRERLAARVGADSISAFALLTKIGQDCVGALQIVPEEQAPPWVLVVETLPIDHATSAAQLRRSISAGTTAWEGAQDHDFRISAIAGAQEKMALLHWNGAWHEPLGATPTSHILKLPLGVVGNLQADIRRSVENEWLCARIIEAYGLPVAQSEMLQFEDQKVLSVRRFDRRIAPDGTWLMRLPQEDLCQATGTSYLYKYESDGGPGIATVMRQLENSRNAGADRRMFFASQVVFWLLAATDGHAKNFSVSIARGGAYQLTPLYDVLSAYPIMQPFGPMAAEKAKMAMAVRGKNVHYHWVQIQRRHFAATGAAVGLGKEGDELAMALAAKTPAVVEAVRATLPGDFPGQVAEPIFEGMLKAAQRLLSGADS